jgi:hypothetical protein
LQLETIFIVTRYASTNGGSAKVGNYIVRGLLNIGCQLGGFIA